MAQIRLSDVKIEQEASKRKSNKEAHKDASVWGKKKKKKSAFNHSVAVKVAFCTNSTEL